MDWQQYLTENFDRHVEELCQLVRIPSISALPESAEDVVAAAKEVLGRTG